MAERASALGMGQGPVELRGRPAPLPRRTDAVASEEPISSGVDGRQLAGWLAPDREVYGTGSTTVAMAFSGIVHPPRTTKDLSALGLWAADVDLDAQFTN